jgi:SPP1 gp7 family putative phage head morphogenesis protein
LHETIPGRPPAQAALSSAGVLYNIDQFASNFFERGAIKATLLTIDGNPLPAEMERLEAWWKRFFSGSKSAWETAAVRAGVTPVVVGEGMENLATADLSEERRQDIATALGVPHSIVMSNAANYATANQDAISFYDMTIIPALTFLAEIVNESLLAPAGYRLELRPEEMSIYQADEERRSNSMLNYVQAGLKPSLAAEILGVSLPYGVEYKDLDPAPPPAPAPAPAPEPSPAPEPDMAKSAEIARFRRWAKKRHNPDPNQFASDILTPVDKAALLEAGDDTSFFTSAGGTWPTSHNSTRDKASLFTALPMPDQPEDNPELRPIDIPEPRKRDRLERQATEDIQTALTKQQRDIYNVARRMSAEEFIGDVNAELERQVRDIQNETKLYDRLRRALLESVDLGVFVAVEQLESIGLGMDWTLVNEDARAWAQNHIGTLIGGIDETTMARTRSAVAEWIQNGEPLPKLIEDLEPIFGAQRAQLIASTEVTRAYAEANQRVYREAGIRYMEWRAAADELMCPICGALNGQIVGIDDKFDGALDEEIRAQFRVNFAIPPAHPRCRCWIVPVVADIGA